MKMDFEQFQANAGADPKLPASGAKEGADESEESGEETRMEPRPRPQKPTMDMEVGPDGATFGMSGPVEVDDPVQFAETLMQIQEQNSGPELSEQVLELATDPKVQKALKQVWYGPEGAGSKPSPARAESRTMAEPTAELDPADEPTAETDGGELRNDNIYQITPEGLVAVLQQQVAEVSALKPDMTLEELEQFMDANEERLVGEAQELLEALDSDG
jgi:hypothetical protein